MKSATLALAALSVLSGCKRPIAPDPSEDSESAKAREKRKPHAGAHEACYVGPLEKNEPSSHSNPISYCVGGVLYRGAAHRLGRINVFGVEGHLSEGRYVKLHASRHDDLFAALSEEGACRKEEAPLPQARSDWSPEEGSHHTSEARLHRASYLRARSLEPVELITVRAPPKSSRKRHAAPASPADTVSVQLENPFDFPLSGLSLVVHYEGGPGKGMPHYETKRVPTLQPGASRKLTFPASVQEDGHWYRYASLSLEGTSGGCEFVPSTYRR